MPPKSGRNKNGSSANENFAAALTEVSDRLTRLVQDEIELAKTEVITKASSLARGAAAVAAGAVFGVFAVVFFLLTLAWVLDGIFVNGAGSLWLGFLIVLVVLLVLTGGAFTFAWKKLKVGAPTPKMAIDEGKKIKNTVTHFGNGNGNGNGNGQPTPERIAAIVASAADAATLPPEWIPEVPHAALAAVSPGESPAIAAPTPAPVVEMEPDDAVIGGAVPVAPVPEPIATEPAPIAAEPTVIAADPTPIAAEPTLIAADPTDVIVPAAEPAADGAPEASPHPGAEN